VLTRIGNGTMRSLLLCMFLVPMTLPASAEEWNSRGGNCYEWEGRWHVQQEQSGVWVGEIDFLHVGGPCSPATGQYLTNETRAVIVGGDFFGRRTTGASVCHLHGNVRGAEVRGWEQCSGVVASLPFALRFTPGEERNDRSRR
jgi:hypothetical protein